MTQGYRDAFEGIDLSGWSQSDLAEKLEVSRQSVNAIETGKYDPSLPLAFRVAELFDLPIEEIFVSPSRRSSKAI